MNTNNHNRREFVKASVIGAAGITIGGVGFSAKSYAAIVGANERIHVAVIGVRNQGTVHLTSWCMLKEGHNVQVRAICDTDEALFAQPSGRARRANTFTSKSPRPTISGKAAK